MSRLGLGLLCATMACVPLPPLEDVPDHVDGTPEIISFYLECDLEEDKWTLLVDTRFWTGGIDTWWSVDGAYIEPHAMNTEHFAENGSGESLKLKLDIVANFLDVDDGSTSFSCGSDPSGHLVLYETDGTPVFCREFGAELVDWILVSDLPQCP